MMKHFKRITAAVLVAVTALATTACGGKKGPTVDATKTQLNVGVFNAGLGTTYFDEMAKDFEAYYAETSFETGKNSKFIVYLSVIPAGGAVVLHKIAPTCFFDYADGVTRFKLRLVVGAVVALDKLPVTVKVLR